MRITVKSGKRKVELFACERTTIVKATKLLAEMAESDAANAQPLADAINAVGVAMEAYKEPAADEPKA